MNRFASLALASVILFAVSALADAEKEGGKKPLGTWKRIAGDTTITFEIKADSAHFTVVNSNNGNTIEVEADYGVTKDGVVFGRINKVTKKGGDDGPSEGDLFSFRFSIDKDKLTVSELKTSAGGEDAKQAVEGEYTKEKDK